MRAIMGVGLLVSEKNGEKIGIQNILVLCDCNSFFGGASLDFSLNKLQKCRHDIICKWLKWY